MKKYALSSTLTSAFGGAVLAVSTSSAPQLWTSLDYLASPNYSLSEPAMTAAAEYPNTTGIEPNKPGSAPTIEQILEHLSYLGDASRVDNGLISAETAAEARLAWLECWKATGYALPIPAACTGPDGQLQYTWDRGDHHLELNFSPTESPSYFYRHRQTGELWMDDFAFAGLSPMAIEKLRLFI